MNSGLGSGKIEDISLTQTWTPTVHLSFHPWGKRFDEPLVMNLSESIPFPWVHFSVHGCVSTSPVQTRIGIRWVNLPSLRVRWSHFHIPEWYISFSLDHSGVSGSWWIFDVGEWRRGSSLSINFYFNWLIFNFDLLPHTVLPIYEISVLNSMSSKN